MLRQETETLLYGKPLVKPTQVETELEKIRSDAAKQDAAREAQATGSASARARATLSNLIILNASRSSERVDEAIDKLIDELCIAYPSRFFIVDANLGEDAGGTGIATAVSSRCFLTDSGAHVCSEEIYVSVEKKSVSLVKNLLVSLFAPDVDVVLLVLGDLVRNDPQRSFETLLSALGPMCERVVYDSGQFHEYDKSLFLLSNVSDGQFEKLSDVNWKRTRRWRALISEGFDAERLSDTSMRISRVSLFCRSSREDLQAGRVPADALLIAAWLCVSLGESEIKRCANKDSLLLEAAKNSNVPQLEFISEPKSNWTLGEAGLAAVEILADTPDGSAKLRIERTLERGTAEISLGFSGNTGGTHSSCDFNARNAPFAALPLGELVLSHIVSRRDDLQYLKTLELSLELSKICQKG